MEWNWTVAVLTYWLKFLTYDEREKNTKCIENSLMYTVHPFHNGQNQLDMNIAQTVNQS